MDQPTIAFAKDVPLTDFPATVKAFQAQVAAMRLVATIWKDNTVILPNPLVDSSEFITKANSAIGTDLSVTFRYIPDIELCLAVYGYRPVKDTQEWIQVTRESIKTQAALLRALAFTHPHPLIVPTAGSLKTRFLQGITVPGVHKSVPVIIATLLAGGYSYSLRDSMLGKLAFVR